MAQHRRSSRKTGRGRAGMRAQMFMNFLSEGKAKRGFVPKPIRKPTKALNLAALERLTPSPAESGKQTFDLSSVGVGKLLGVGSAPKNAEIIVGSWSRKAEEKVRAAGGSLRKP